MPKDKDKKNTQQNKRFCQYSTNELSKIFFLCYSLLGNGEKGEFHSQVSNLILQQNPGWKPAKSTIRYYCNFDNIPEDKRAYLEKIYSQTLINVLKNKFFNINSNINELGLELEKKYSNGN
jgi:hypothetical protein